MKKYVVRPNFANKKKVIITPSRHTTKNVEMEGKGRGNCVISRLDIAL